MCVLTATKRQAQSAPTGSRIQIRNLHSGRSRTTRAPRRSRPWDQSGLQSLCKTHNMKVLLGLCSGAAQLAQQLSFYDKLSCSHCITLTCSSMLQISASHRLCVLLLATAYCAPSASDDGKFRATRISFRRLLCVLPILLSRPFPLEQLISRCYAAANCLQAFKAAIVDDPEQYLADWEGTPCNSGNTYSGVKCEAKTDARVTAM